MQLGYGYDKYEQPPKPGPTSPTPASTPLAQPSPADRDGGGKTGGRSPAPAWSLPDASRKTVSLGQYQGRQMVFRHDQRSVIAHGYSDPDSLGRLLLDAEGERQ
ncbi:MAG: hypothetical protein ACREHD_09900 [Pirellulales bacterium]